MRRLAFAIALGLTLASFGPLLADVGTQSGNHPAPRPGTRWAMTEQRNGVSGSFRAFRPGAFYAEGRSFDLWAWSRYTRLTTAPGDVEFKLEGRVLAQSTDFVHGRIVGGETWHAEISDAALLVSSAPGTATLHATLTSEQGATCDLDVAWTPARAEPFNPVSPFKVPYRSVNAFETSAWTGIVATGACLATDLDATGDGAVWNRVDRRTSEDVLRDDRLSPGGIVTIAGVRSPGGAGDGGPARWANLGFPTDVASMPDGSTLILDNGIRRVRPDGIIETFISTDCQGDETDPAPDRRLCSPSGIAVGNDGTVYVSDYRTDLVHRFSPSGEPQGTLGQLPPEQAPPDAVAPYPQGLAVDAQGRVFVAQTQANRIVRLDPDGAATIVAGNGSCDGHIDEPGPTPLATQICGPTDVAVTGDGTLYVTEAPAHRVRRISGATVTTVIAAGPVPATAGSITGQSPFRSAAWWTSVALGPDGKAYVSDAGGGVWRIDEPNRATLVVGSMLGAPDDGGPALTARLEAPNAIAFDGNGYLLICETQGSAVRLADVGAHSASPARHRAPRRL